MRGQSRTLALVTPDLMTKRWLEICAIGQGVWISVAAVGCLTWFIFGMASDERNRPSAAPVFVVSGASVVSPGPLVAFDVGIIKVVHADNPLLDLSLFYVVLVQALENPGFYLESSFPLPRFWRQRCYSWSSIVVGVKTVESLNLSE